MNTYTRSAPVVQATGTAIVARLATSRMQDDGIALSMAGADLARYKKNPVLLVNHDPDEMPVGRVENVKTNMFEMTGELRFSQVDPRARHLEALVREGTISAVSIRFWPHKVDRTGTATSWSLIETSLVSVPLDSEAIVLSRSARNGVDPAATRLLDAAFGPRPYSQEWVRQRIRGVLDDMARDGRLRNALASALDDMEP